MNAVLKMLDPTTCENSRSAISSPELACGHTRYDKLGDLTIDQFGRALAPANLSARQAREWGLLTSGISGPPSTGSSVSAALQSSLENRLRVRLSDLGSTLYTLTWKPWATPSGQSRFRLRASVRRTSEIDCSCGPGPQEQFGRWFKPEGLTAHSTTLRMAHPNGGNTGSEWEQCSGQQRQQSQDRSTLHGVADLNSERLHGFDPLLQWEKSRRVAEDSVEIDGCGPVNGFWRDADWISCRDDRWRSVEPGSFPLVNGAPSRMGRLRADWRSSAGKEASGWRVGRLRCYGNAINAEAAKTFIEAYLDAQN